MPGGLALSFHARGLLVAGDTYQVKEVLKPAGGRWDAELKGWVFPFDGKQAVLDALAASHDRQALAVRDGAKVQLSLAMGSGAGRELLVTGETFPVKALLKKEGGTWTPAIKAWTFRNRLRAELLKALRASPDVGCVEDAEPGPSTPQRLPARHGPAADEGASDAKGVAKSRLHGKQELALKDGGGVQKKPQQQQQQQQLQQRKHDGLKVVESGKRASKAERRADGSRAKTQEEKKERKISCARTGAHVQTESVTRKRKVVETGDKVVETKTIVVKRVRSKK